MIFHDNSNTPFDMNAIPPLPQSRILSLNLTLNIEGDTNRFRIILIQQFERTKLLKVFMKLNLSLRWRKASCWKEKYWITQKLSNQNTQLTKNY